ncbi:MAG: ATP-binding protein [Candidatus Falkowbacteria bacterium]
MYIKRQLGAQIEPFLAKKEAISIIGPRQAGKTTFIQNLAKRFEQKGKRIKFITFEKKADLDLFNNNIEDFKKIVQQYEVVFIDEFQYSRDGGQKLKYLYDTTKIKFIISGSSSLELTFQTGKYLVGRLIEFSLMPFSFREFLSAKDREMFVILENISSADIFSFNLKDVLGREINSRLAARLEEYLVFGGYPAVVLSTGAEEKKKVLEGIYDKYLLKDIKDLLRLATDNELDRLGKFLAGQIGNIIKYQELVGACGLNYKELKKHLNILCKTYIISLVAPFFTNKRTELVKNPKVYFNDMGLRNYSLVDWRAAGIRNDIGALAENYGFILLKNIFSRGVKYWRTKAKAEVDFIIEKEQTVYPVEIKYISKRLIGKSLYSFIEKFNPPVALILTKDYLGEEKINKTTVKFIPLAYF